jgi:virulence-associated protein VapD
MKHRKLVSARGVATAAQPGSSTRDAGMPYLPNARSWAHRMYAIAFDLDTETLQNTYPNASWRNAYEDIRRVLAEHHFDRQQGSVYFGDADKVDPVRCVLAVQDLTRQFGWFAGAVNDIRMLRIEENNDLRPAIEDMDAALRQAAVPPPAH